MLITKTIPILSLSALLAACGSSSSTDRRSDTGQDKSDQISGNDDRSGLLPNAERRLARLVTPEDIGKRILVPDNRMPYPDTYWPMVDDGIASNWIERDGTECELTSAPEDQGGGFVVHVCEDPQASPLEKFITMIAPTQVDEAMEWERTNHGKQRPGVQDWFGHCPGWVATTLLNEPVKTGVSVRFDGVDLEQCEDGADGCTRFEIGDINALGAEAHEGAVSRFIGARCDTEPTEIERDEHGRIIRNGAGCKGLNAGAMVIVLGTQIKINQRPFAIDAQNEFTTNQIWNQPAVGYTVNRFEPLTESEAANLVVTGGESRTGDQDEYIFNSNAKGFVFIDFTLHWVTELGPNTAPVAGTESLNATRMVAVVELDSDPDSPLAEIIGGEYLDDESVGADRLRNAPFAWLAIGMNVNAAHNPFVRGRLVQQLMDIAVAAGHEADPDQDSGQQ